MRTFLLNALATIFVCSTAAVLNASPSPTETTKPTTKTTTHHAKASTTRKAASPSSKSGYKDQVADLKTNKGTITIRFFPDVAPNHVKNFIDLARKGFYNGSKFHRVIPGFMIQGGDPNSIAGDPETWGTGGSGTNVKAEFSSIHHARGIVSMARSQSRDSASSQFFIVVADAGNLDGQYSAFGKVTAGMDVADAIVNTPRDSNDRPRSSVIIKSVTIRPAVASEKGPTPK